MFCAQILCESTHVSVAAGPVSNNSNIGCTHCMNGGIYVLSPGRLPDKNDKLFHNSRLRRLYIDFTVQTIVVKVLFLFGIRTVSFPEIRLLFGRQ